MLISNITTKKALGFLNISILLYRTYKLNYIYFLFIYMNKNNIKKYLI